MRETILDFICTLFNNLDIKIYEDQIILGEYKITFEKFWDDVNNILDNTNHDEATIYDSNNFETAIRLENYGRMPSSMAFRRQSLEMSDDSNGISYKVGKPSLKYIIFLINKLKDSSSNDEFRRRYSISISRVFESYAHYSDVDTIERDDEKVITLEELLNKIFSMYYTVQIKTSKSKQVRDFENYFNSVIFHLGFKLDNSFIKIALLDDLFNFNRRGRTVRRGSDIEAPRRFYIKDLIYHYQMALASGISYVEYISYYHVIEHFMEKIYTDEFVNSIKAKITDPRFSFNRDKDIKSLIKEINDHTRFQKEEMIINEREAIRLTLNKYIDISKLKVSLNNLDNSLLMYYEQNEIRFSKGEKIPFSNNNTDEIIKKMANRIYNTRNSLVHSKETDKSKYVPFEHDDQLMREIPLMRLIAEEIIIETSEIIK